MGVKGAAYGCGKADGQLTIRLYTVLPERFSDLAEVIRIFSPDAAVLQSAPETANFVHRHEETTAFSRDVCALGNNAFSWTTPLSGDLWERKRRVKRGLKLCCYYLLRRLTGLRPPWGSLTGIRPTSLLHRRLSSGMRPEAARAAMMRVYDLSEARADLLLETVATQRALPAATDDMVDLYIGIPFCPTRCAYCSFFAEAIGKGRKAAPYLTALFTEMEAVAALLWAKGLSRRALYIGGGTPTALPVEALKALLEKARVLFPDVREFTVEAGRPDSMSEEKLALLRSAGVTRISVNPQSMRAETLRAIGRAHTPEDTVRAFHMARRMGFHNINMDVIAALPGETADHFRETLRKVEMLRPDSITVHTLARKHGSRLNEFGFTPVSADTAREMLDLARETARGLAMRPYYLYRQKYVAGNLENVAYARPGMECLYNVDMMEETVSVLAMGAGAISKRVFSEMPRIERAPNVGDIGHYMARVEAMIERKRRLWRDDP